MDDLDHEASDTPKCPICGEESCTHEILSWSACNGDWFGLLPDRTSTIEETLRYCLWKAITAIGRDDLARLAAQGEIAFLDWKSLLSGYDPEDPDNCDWSTQLRDYWLELARDHHVDEWRSDFDGGVPGSADTFGFLYAEPPEEVVRAIVAKAESDIERVCAWAGISRPPR